MISRALCLAVVVFVVVSALVVACRGVDDASAPPPALEPESGLVAVTVGASRLTGTAPRASGGFPSVVQLFPLSEPETKPKPRPDADPEPEPEPVVMDQYGNAFHPRVLVVKTGGLVSFKNSEDVLHNVRVVNRKTRETIFNVGTPVVGAYEHRFETPGVYDVSCQIHPSMAAFLVVTEALHAVVADARGGFAMEGIPPGSYLVKVWNLDESRHRERPVELEGDVTIDLTRQEGDRE